MDVQHGEGASHRRWPIASRAIEAALRKLLVPTRNKLDQEEARDPLLSLHQLKQAIEQCRFVPTRAGSVKSRRGLV